jgi:predicted  nucleic acid-binding Zn-ribbon protein
MAKAKFDIKTEATRGLYAGAGVADLAVEAVREYVSKGQTRFAGVQKDVAGFDYSPQALRKQVNARVEALSKEAKARRAAAEARVAGLRKEATTRVSENADTATDAYGDLVKRGESLVSRIRRQEATKATTRSAKTTSSKAKTTSTQAKKTAKKSTTAAKKTAKKSPAKSSAKATATAAKSTASNAARATADGASKVGN